MSTTLLDNPWPISALHQIYTDDEGRIWPSELAYLHSLLDIEEPEPIDYTAIELATAEKLVIGQDGFHHIDFAEADWTCGYIYPVPGWPGKWLAAYDNEFDWGGDFVITATTAEQAAKIADRMYDEEIWAIRWQEAA